MSKGTIVHLPERLSSAGATDFERRLLGAASREQPSRELSARMASAIGVAPPAPPSLEPSVPDTSVLAPEAGAAGLRGLLPWISGAVVVVAAGAILAVRSNGSEPPPVHSPSTPASALAITPSPPDKRAELPVAPSEESTADAAPPVAPQRRAPSVTADLEEQISLIDAARRAVAAGEGDRALAILRQYRAKYGAGSFRPEAAALRIEALVKLGRESEARALAARFVAEHRGSPLADRVARIAGAGRP